MGKVATYPLPLRGSPPPQSGGPNQKGLTSGQGGYITPAASGIPTATERGAKSEVAHLWARWPHNPCRIGDPLRLRAGGRIRSGPQVGKMTTQPLLPRESPPPRSGGKIRSGPQVGGMATQPLPPQRSPSPQSGGQNQKWPTCGQGDYTTLTASEIPTASERGPSQNWPTFGVGGYITPAASGIPIASERGAKSKLAHLWA